MLNNVMACFIGAVSLLSVPVAAVAATGLNGNFYKFDDVANQYGVKTLAKAQVLIDAAGAPSVTFLGNTICFPNCAPGVTSVSAYTSATGFLSGSATNISANNINHIYLSATELTGFLNISTAGNHLFDLYSDDGTSIYIDGVPVVVEDGENLIGVKNSATINLSSGSHAIRVLHFEDGGVAGFKLLLDAAPIGGTQLSTTPLAGIAGVPEPATWAMMLVGFGGLGAMLRRRRGRVALTA
jgi:hypothetical protein